MNTTSNVLMALKVFFFFPQDIEGSTVQYQFIGKKKELAKTPVTWSPHQNARNAHTQLKWLIKVGCPFLIVFKTAKNGWTVNWNLDAHLHVQNSTG